MPSRRVILAAGLAAPLAARAQDAYPNRPIRVIVPYSAGGQSDTVARVLAQPMSQFLGVPMPVENRTGAGGSIAAGVVAAAPADGYTIFLESFTFVVAPFLHKGLPFDYETAFTPIGQAVSLPYVLVVKKDFPADDLAGYVAHAKRNPGLAYGTPGIGSTGHVAGTLLASRAGIQLEHVPYRGGQDAARDVAAGTLDSVISSANSLRPLIEAGRAKGIALTTAERRGTLASLPTIAESGFPGFDITSWNGFLARTGTPAPIMARLEAALLAAVRDPAAVARLGSGGNDPVAAGSTAFAERIRLDREMVRKLVRETGMKVE